MASPPAQVRIRLAPVASEDQSRMRTRIRLPAQKSEVVKSPKRKQRKVELERQKQYKAKKAKLDLPPTSGSSTLAPTSFTGYNNNVQDSREPSPTFSANDNFHPYESPLSDSFPTPHPSNSSHNDSLLSPIFVRAVFEDRCEVFQLLEDLYVFNGWDPKKEEPTVSAQYFDVQHIGSPDSIISESSFNGTMSSVPERRASLCAHALSLTLNSRAPTRLLACLWLSRGRKS